MVILLTKAFIFIFIYNLLDKHQCRYIGYLILLYIVIYGIIYSIILATISINGMALIKKRR
jgi:prolipoprotein diacylglyceryltransferase